MLGFLKKKTPKIRCTFQGPVMLTCFITAMCHQNIWRSHHTVPAKCVPRIFCWNRPNVTAIPRNVSFPTTAPHISLSIFLLKGRGCLCKLMQMGISATHYLQKTRNDSHSNLLVWGVRIFMTCWMLCCKASFSGIKFWWGRRKGFDLGPTSHRLHPRQLLQCYCTSPISSCDPKTHVHPGGKEVWALEPAWRRPEVLLVLNDFILVRLGGMLSHPH